MADVSISDDGNHIWACTDDNAVYYRPGIEGEWEPQAGRSTRVQVAGNGDHILFLNTAGNLYYRAGIANGFQHLEGITDVAHMSMSADDACHLRQEIVDSSAGRLRRATVCC